LWVPAPVQKNNMCPTFPNDADQDEVQCVLVIAVFPILADVVEVKTGSRSTAHWRIHFIRSNGWLRHSFAQLITLLDIDGISQNWEGSNSPWYQQSPIEVCPCMKLVRAEPRLAVQRDPAKTLYGPISDVVAWWVSENWFLITRRATPAVERLGAASASPSLSTRDQCAYCMEVSNNGSGGRCPRRVNTLWIGS